MPATTGAGRYDPFAEGALATGVRTAAARDVARSRLFDCEIWYPAESGAPAGLRPERDAAPRPGSHPLVVFSQHSGGSRLSSTFLGRHLASHGYVVAAMDHSETVAPELARRDGETDAQRQARIAAIIASRVPDVRFLLDCLLPSGERTGQARAGGPLGGLGGIGLHPARVAVAGHSFGGWTALATPDADQRVRAVVAMAPGGAANPRPGLLPLTLSFDWGRDVPVLYLAAQDDVLTPPAGVAELFARTPATSRMFVLSRADHHHFVDDVEGVHETFRAADFPADSAWMPAAMRPIGELTSGAQAHVFVRGLTLAHLDATLRQSAAAERFLAGDVVADLAARGIGAAEIHRDSGGPGRPAAAAVG